MAYQQPVYQQGQAPPQYGSAQPVAYAYAPEGTAGMATDGSVGYPPQPVYGGQPVVDQHNQPLIKTGEGERFSSPNGCRDIGWSIAFLVHVFVIFRMYH